MWSMFEAEYYHYNKKTKIGKWSKQIFFYKGDFTKFNEFKNDRRFCEAKTRRNVKFLGTKENIDFPIVYPFKLDNGLIFKGNEYEQIKYDEERES